MLATLPDFVVKGVFAAQSWSRVFPDDFLLLTKLAARVNTQSREERSHMIQQSRLISQSWEQVSAINVIGDSADFCAW